MTQGRPPALLPSDEAGMVQEELLSLDFGKMESASGVGRALGKLCL